ncbi:hypothetical protein U4E84_16590 [Halorubrum sp. AD140]|uniref:hypothetical protein n=1 Tax=Halorubrum sp. AD140 TaxID=3050073 RepID=UPI002ACC4124|nr:hypothetical protein [Halorubrum sp. AD140]MDZ5812960.1 hypothetical protein [Halorubrum sp. AD140]
MFPAYVVPPADITEVLFALSELNDEADQDAVAQFVDESTRKVRESIRVLRELNVVVGDDALTVNIEYDYLVQQLPPSERSAIIERALLNYQPFIDYATYLKRGYSSEQATQMVFAANADLSNDAEYVQTYFERLGTYSGILTEEGDVSIEVREIPTDSTQSIEKLREALDSELEVRIYLDEILGEELMNFLDEDTKSDLVSGYMKHSSSPRDGISAIGRSFEDFLRHIGADFGSEDRDYGTDSGIIGIVNHLQGDDLVRKVHKRRVVSLAEIRNKGGAHGDDTEVLERWDTSSEVALNSAITATLLLRSIYLFASEDRLVL